VRVGICTDKAAEPIRLVIERTGKMLHALQRALRQ